MQITFDPHSPEDLEVIRRVLGSATAAPALDALEEQPAPVVRPEDVFKPGPDADSDRELAQTYGAGVVPPASPYWINDETGECATSAEDNGLSAEGFRRATREEWDAAPGLPAPIQPPMLDPREEDSDPPGAEDSDDHLDSAGLPWDARIHASTRTKLKADGRWKPKRGVDAAIVASVEAELRAVMAIPAGGHVAAPPPPPPAAAAIPPPPPPAAPVPPSPPAAASAGPATASTGTAKPEVPAATGSATPATISPSDDPKTFPTFMQWLGPKLTAKTLTQDQVREAVQAEGLPSVEKLMARPDLIPLVLARLKA